jgi:hypothetical protein
VRKKHCFFLQVAGKEMFFGFYDLNEVSEGEKEYSIATSPFTSVKQLEMGFASQFYLDMEQWSNFRQTRFGVCQSFHVCVSSFSFINGITLGHLFDEPIHLPENDKKNGGTL